MLDVAFQTVAIGAELCGIEIFAPDLEKVVDDLVRNVAAVGSWWKGRWRGWRRGWWEAGRLLQTKLEQHTLENPVA